MLVFSVAECIAFFERMGAHDGRFPQVVIERTLQGLWDGFAPRHVDPPARRLDAERGAAPAADPVCTDPVCSCQRRQLSVTLQDTAGSAVKTGGCECAKRWCCVSRERCWMRSDRSRASEPTLPRTFHAFWKRRTRTSCHAPRRKRTLLRSRSSPTC